EWARGPAAADQVVEPTGIGRLGQRATRDPQVRRPPGVVGQVSVAMRAQRQHAPEAARPALPAALGPAPALAQRIALVAPADDQPLRMQPRVDLRKTR